ncbi:MAG TPA: excinuclease ABC subunit B [Dehalococcoidia bacterium]|jgi:excinuclease ABC subunit B|nr:excinuclease ABC subunit B [Dehalococcoidia bacterium]
MTEKFNIVSDLKMTGDQPSAVSNLVKGMNDHKDLQTLLGVTGSGKTFTMANVVEQIQKPTLVIAHNKTLAAQLASEFKEFFPNNAVEYFVSYYDYYTPEAYVPGKDLYIEKDASVNDELTKLRLSTTTSLLTRKDVLVVASVSCIFGLGDPGDYFKKVAHIAVGVEEERNVFLRKLVSMQYERNDYDLVRGKFRVRGEIVDIIPAYADYALRIEFFGDEIEKITKIEPLTGELLEGLEQVDIYPSNHFVTSQERVNLAVNDIQDELSQHLTFLKKENRLLEAARLESRTHYDIEMMSETGSCAGIENYSRHLQRRDAGSLPWTLLDYFPEDHLIFIDESHMTLPQIRAMYKGDYSRKSTLIDYGFRLPSALDNRPLRFEEFEKKMKQVVFVSATPGPYEIQHSPNVVEQVIRPTGLLDPTIEVKPSAGQIDDLIEEIRIRIKNNERILITTLTKRMSEELADYLSEIGIKNTYLHSDIQTLDRIEILRDLRLGVYDVVIGINLLREGLDLPEVSLIAILDADKEGYLRSFTSMIQTIGRAARHCDGHVIMYADKVTESMRKAIEETYRRREIQEKHNNVHGIIPRSIQKEIHDLTENLGDQKKASDKNELRKELSQESLLLLIKDLELQMKQSARNWEFEKAAQIRDELVDLKKLSKIGEVIAGY